MASVTDILQSVESLPALPSTASRVIMMLSSKDANLDEIRDLIRLDEAITVAVLRCANSVGYGMPGKVFSLNESIVRLGTRQLLKITLEQQVSKIMNNAGESYGLRRGALWRGSLGGAIAAELIAKEAGYKDVELCFVCALLRDIGKLAFDAHFGSERILECLANINPGESFLEAERTTLGVDHAELGGALAEHWDLPEQIANAIRMHHDPPAEGDLHDELYDIVHAADVISLWMGLGIGHDGLQYPLAPHVREGLMGSRTHAEKIITQSWIRLQDLESDIEQPAVQGRSA